MRIHIVGIGGAGMSAIARLLLAGGHQVSGSDNGRWPLSDALVPLGARVFDSFAAAYIGDAEIVLRSSAYGEDHVEVVAARAAGREVWRRHEAWAFLAKGKRVLAVAGTHGKTTTTALAWHALRAGGVDASLICGAPLRDIGANAHAGTADVLVIEADEYDRTFLALRPHVALVTNVEHDHVDQFPRYADVVDAFQTFVSRSAKLVACGDDPGARALVTYHAGNEDLARLRFGGVGEDARRGFADPDWSTTYGTQDVDVAVRDARATENGMDFVLVSDDTRLAVSTRLVGMHNVLNATGALVAVSRLGVPMDVGARGVASFPGTERRLEVLGVARQIRVVDDYAHHPTEIRASVAAMRAGANGRLIVAFQPHTPSRLAAFRDGFADALRGADVRLVVRTFPSAREVDDGGAGSRDLAERAAGTYVADPEAAARKLAEIARPGDTVLILGAGDIRRAGERFLELLREGAPP